MTTKTSAFALIFAILLCSAATASAQIQGVRPEGHFNLTRGINVGLGARVDIPIVPEGFLSAQNDELAISPGLDLLAGDNTWFAVPVALQWNFYLQREWSVFPELGLALLLGDHRGKHNVDLDLVVAAGARYHFSDRNALLMRLGWPILFQIGVTF